MKPIININGTHPDDLASTYGMATDALRTAIRLLCDIAPHPRDYPTVQDWSASNLDHARLVVALADVRDKVEAAEVHIHDQILDGKK